MDLQRGSCLVAWSSSRSSTCCDIDRDRSKIAPGFLLALDGLEEAAEVAGTEAFKVLALDDFDEDGRTVHEWFREQLEQVAAYTHKIPVSVSIHSIRHGD